MRATEAHEAQDRERRISVLAVAPPLRMEYFPVTVALSFIDFIFVFRIAALFVSMFFLFSSPRCTLVCCSRSCLPVAASASLCVGFFSLSPPIAFPPLPSLLSPPLPTHAYFPSGICFLLLHCRILLSSLCVCMGICIRVGIDTHNDTHLCTSPTSFSLSLTLRSFSFDEHVCFHSEQ